MVFELHADTAATPPAFALRLVVQDGPGAAYETVPLPCAAAGDAAEVLAGPGACILTAFLDLAQPQTFASTADWCGACSNSAWPACGIAGLQASLESAGVCDGDGSAAGWQLALAAILPALAVAALAATAFVGYRKKVLQEAAAVSGGGPKLMVGAYRVDSSHSAWAAGV